jgi:hypothetical protein
MIINLRLIAVLPFSMKNIVGNICLATTTLFLTHSLAAATVSHFLSPQSASEAGKTQLHALLSGCL